MVIQEDFSLQQYNTFGINASTKLFAEVSSLHALEALSKDDRFEVNEKLVIGGGSNLLFTRDYEGLVLKSDFRGIDLIDEDDLHYTVKVGSGENWHQFVLYCITHGYGGVENLSLIPGLVGAAPIQNIGAYGVELKEVFVSLEAFHLVKGEVDTFSNDQCKFGYRDSIFKNEVKGEYLITSVTLRLTKEHKLNVSYGAIATTLEAMHVDEFNIKEVSDAVIAIRTSKLPDPAEIGNAGSFFKNPVIEKIDFEGLRAEFQSIPGYMMAGDMIKVPAAWLIEQAGWKGHNAGTAGTYPMQPLVLINNGGATGNDIWQLAQQIKGSVEAKFGITLAPEVTVL